MCTVLKKMRGNMGLTQSELGERLGISYSHVSMIENARLLPSTMTAEKLESVFKMPVQDLLAPEEPRKRLHWQPVAS